MVSNGKRMHYDDSSSSDSENNKNFDSFNDEIVKYSYKHKDEQEIIKKFQTRRSRKPKCSSRNALMARENRLRKKMYLNSLENQVAKLKRDNENFIKVIDSQSLLIGNMKKEIKYLKSVIANSSDIGNLIKNIRNSTGMSVSSSLDKSLSLNVSKKIPIAKKTAHPWEEDEDKMYPSTPESYNIEGGFNFLDDIPLDPLPLEGDLILDSTPKLTDHTYTTNFQSSLTEDEGEDVGVCLHVSKHKVSVEFCPSCSDNARTAWID